jgi:hypothetical protein
LGSLWSSWGSCGIPLGRLGRLWGPFGSLVESHWGVFWIFLLLDVTFRGKTSKPLRLRIKTSRSEFSRRYPPLPAAPATPRKRCQEPLLGPHLHTRRGPG